jgi:hypothetical protein
MSERRERNLDLLAANTANAIVVALVTGSGKQKVDDAKSLDNVATKALGVFQENGVYAGTLFLLSTSQSAEMARYIAGALTDLTGRLGFDWTVPGKTPDALLPYYSETVCAQLDRLLLVKGLFEQTLIYVRYGAKARQQEGKAEEAS